MAEELSITELLRRAMNPLEAEEVVHVVQAQVPRRFQPLPLTFYRDQPKPEFLLSELIIEGAVGLIVGKPWSGKSWVVVEIMTALASGKPAFGEFDSARRCRVLYVPGEGQYTVWPRFSTFARERGMSEEEMGERIFCTHDIPALTDPKQVEEFRQELAEAYEELGGAFDLIVLDTLSQAAPGADTKEAAVISQVIRTLRDLQREIFEKEGRRPVFVVVHHSNKTDPRDPSGSVQLSGDTDFVYAVVKQGDPDSGCEFTLEKVKNRADGGRRFRPRLCAVDPVGDNPLCGILKPLGSRDVSDESPSKEAAAIRNMKLEKVVAALKKADRHQSKALTKSELEEETGVKGTTLGRVLDKLELKKSLVTVEIPPGPQGGRPAKGYRLVDCE